MRWFLRRSLRRLRKTENIPATEWNSVLYLFAGTFGDFVQILKPLELLANAAPHARLFLLAPEEIAADFKLFLPPSVRQIGFGQALGKCLQGIDLLLTNAVGGYRVRYEVLACLGGRLALGFRYHEQRARKSYSATLPLTPAIRNFETANLGLLRLAGVNFPTPMVKGMGNSPLPSGGEGGRREAGKILTGRILFHVGSAGFKEALGLETYCGLVKEVLKRVGDGVEEIISGPGDEDLIARLKSDFPRLRFARYDLAALSNRVKNFEGRLLCFNSFFAHFCRYLGKSATVIHRERIPYGYDCAPLHKQILMSDMGQAFPLVSG